MAAGAGRQPCRDRLNSHRSGEEFLTARGRPGKVTSGPAKIPGPVRPLIGDERRGIYSVSLSWLRTKLVTFCTWSGRNGPPNWLAQVGMIGPRQRMVVKM